MNVLNASASGVTGLDEIGAFTDDHRDRIVAISVWSSMEAMHAGMAQIFSRVDELPFDVWERQPRELMMLTEATGG